MLTVLDQHGKVIAQASAPDFMSPGKPDVFDPAKVAAFFTLHQAPAPDAVAPFETRREAGEGGRQARLRLVLGPVVRVVP